MMRIFKTSILFDFLLVAALLMNCNDDDPVSAINSNGDVSNTNFAAEERCSCEIDVLHHTDLRVEGINGSIEITQKEGMNSALIIVEKRVESESTADAELHLDMLEASIENLTNEIFVHTDQPKNSHGRNYIVNYTIMLPRNLDVTVNTINGIVTLNEIFGNVFVGLVNGSIDSEITIPLDGTITLNVVNGGIELDIPRNTSTQLSATIVNGDISVSNLDLQNRVETLTSLSGRCGDGRGNISLGTINGNILISGF